MPAPRPVEQPEKPVDEAIDLVPDKAGAGFGAEHQPQPDSGDDDGGQSDASRDNRQARRTGGQRQQPDRRHRQHELGGQVPNAGHGDTRGHLEVRETERGEHLEGHPDGDGAAGGHRARDGRGGLCLEKAVPETQPGESGLVEPDNGHLIDEGGQGDRRPPPAAQS